MHSGVKINSIEIKNFRTELGLSQTDFAKKIGISMRSVQNYEKGSEIPLYMKKLFEYEISAYRKLTGKPVAINSDISMYKSRGTINKNSNNVNEKDEPYSLKEEVIELRTRVKMLIEQKDSMKEEIQYLRDQNKK